MWPTMLALSLRANQDRLYRALLKVLEESETPYTALLAPQFPVSRSPVAAGTHPAVDYALVVSLPPKNVIRIPGWTMSSDGLPVECEIVCPSMSGDEVIVPVIIEIKATISRNISDIYRTLRVTSDRLLEKAAFLLSDFESQQEVIAIAGVGLHWWWFRIPRPSPAHSGQNPGNGYKPSSNAVDPSPNHPLNTTSGHAAGTPKPTPPDTPFVIGTARSAEAVLEVKALVDKIVYRDLPATEDNDNPSKFCEFLGTSSNIVDTKDSEVDAGAGSGVSVSQDGGLDDENPGPGPDGDTQGKRG